MIALGLSYCLFKGFSMFHKNTLTCSSSVLERGSTLILVHIFSNKTELLLCWRCHPLCEPNSLKYINITIYNYCLHMRSTSKVVNLRVVSFPPSALATTYCFPLHYICLGYSPVVSLVSKLANFLRISKLSYYCYYTKTTLKMFKT